MAFLKNIFDFYNNGNAINVVLVAFFAVTYVFAVTFVVCLCDRKQRAKTKSFFIWLSAFAVLVSVGSLVLDFFSAKRFSLFYSAAFSFGVSGALMIEYFILCVQSKICVKDKTEIAGLSAKVCACGNCELNRTATARADFSLFQPQDSAVKKVEKPAIKAGISEVPLRKTERVYMQNDNGGEVLGERFLFDCINKLKEKNLSEEDGLKLSRAEKNISSPIKTETAEDKKRVSDTCGSLITLLSKYK